MAVEAYYYLHENGNLIRKPAAVLDGDPLYFKSSFVRRVWALDPKDRATHWDLVVEALAMGADPDRVERLAERWEICDDDVQNYAERRRFSIEKLEGGWVAVADHTDAELGAARLVGLSRVSAREAISELVRKVGPGWLQGPR